MQRRETNKIGLARSKPGGEAEMNIKAEKMMAVLCLLGICSAYCLPFTDVSSAHTQIFSISKTFLHFYKIY